MLKLQRASTAIALTLALATPAWAAEPDAPTRAAARKLATDGVAALQQGDAELGSQKLEKAFELLQAPSIALWSARALVKRGRLVEASERYLQAGRLPSSEGNEQAVQMQAQKDAARELAELNPRIPKLVVAVDGASPDEVTVSLDGKSVPSALLGEEQFANPGAHQVTGVRGAEHTDEAVTLVEAQSARVVLHFHQPAAGALAPSPAPTQTTPPSNPPKASGAVSSAGTAEPGASHTLAFVALGVGAAGLLTGGITGIVALGKHSDLNDNPACHDGTCFDSVQGDVDSFRTMRTVSSIGFIAGGVFVATGLVLLLTSGPSQKKGEREAPQLALALTPGGASVAGSF